MSRKTSIVLTPAETKAKLREAKEQLKSIKADIKKIEAGKKASLKEFDAKLNVLYKDLKVANSNVGKFSPNGE